MLAFRKNGIWSISRVEEARQVVTADYRRMAVEKATARYAGPKGNLQFPLDEPMPLDLIERIDKLRVKQNATKAAVTRKSPISCKARPA